MVNGNPCCMPLKKGVQIVTHLSMALSVAVGCMGLRLISISSEVGSSSSRWDGGSGRGLVYSSNHYWRKNRLQEPPPPEEEWKSLRGFLIPEYPEDPPWTKNTLHSDLDENQILQQYAKVLLICGLMAICAVFFQFFTSFLLLCCIHKEEKASSQIWVAVNCSVLFCLATCLVLFLCESRSLPAFSLDENLFLSLVTLDTILSIYFLWVVMAFI